VLIVPLFFSSCSGGTRECCGEVPLQRDQAKSTVKSSNHGAKNMGTVLETAAEGRGTSEVPRRRKAADFKGLSPLSDLRCEFFKTEALDTKEEAPAAYLARPSPPRPKAGVIQAAHLLRGRMC